VFVQRAVVINAELACGLGVRLQGRHAIFNVHLRPIRLEASIVPDELAKKYGIVGLPFARRCTHRRTDRQTDTERERHGQIGAHAYVRTALARSVSMSSASSSFYSILCTLAARARLFVFGGVGSWGGYACLPLSATLTLTPSIGRCGPV
jgi:hypothetical protein